MWNGFPLLTSQADEEGLHKKTLKGNLARRTPHRWCVAGYQAACPDGCAKYYGGVCKSEEMGLVADDWTMSYKSGVGIEDIINNRSRGGFFHGLMCLLERTDGGLLAVGDDWCELEVTVDSGACDTVMPASMAKHIKVLESRKSKAGHTYEAANGNTIDNLGERICLMSTEGTAEHRVVRFQVADANKALLSITKLADMCYDCLLGKQGGYLVDTVNGDRIPTERRGTLYTMRLWVKDASAGFTRPE